MTTPCSHPDAVPVYAYVHPTDPHVGDPVQVVNAGLPVAHLCPRCHVQLPANWGCTDCEWEQVETRRLYDPLPEITTVCSRLCPTHQEETP